ncbi:MAG: phosphotransferase family protein [Actinomycetota bacterium]
MTMLRPESSPGQLTTMSTAPSLVPRQAKVTQPDSVDSALSYARKLLHDASPVNDEHPPGTFVGTWLRERAQVRIYLHDPGRIIVDLAIRRKLAGVIPLPQILVAETRYTGAMPPYLITAAVSGTRAHQLLDRGLHQSASTALGRQCARIITRLREVRLNDDGQLAGSHLTTTPWPAERRTLSSWYHHHETRLANIGLGRCEAPQVHAAVMSASHRLASAEPTAPTLVHGLLNARNLIVDPNIGRLRAVLDWDRSAAGDWAQDVGSLLRGVVPVSDGANAAASSWGAFRSGLVEALHTSLYEDGTTVAADGRDDDWLQRARDLDFFPLIASAAVTTQGMRSPSFVEQARHHLLLMSQLSE